MAKAINSAVFALITDILGSELFKSKNKEKRTASIKTMWSLFLKLLSNGCAFNLTEGPPHIFLNSQEPFQSL